MLKLNYFGKPDPERDRPVGDPDGKWPLVLAAAGLIVVAMTTAAACDLLRGKRAAPDALQILGFQLALVVSGAVVEVFAGLVAARVLGLDLGLFESAWRKLAGISILCTALSIPLGVMCHGVLVLFVVGPLRYALLKWLFNLFAGEAFLFTAIVTLILLLAALMAGAPHG